MKIAVDPCMLRTLPMAKMIRKVADIDYSCIDYSCIELSPRDDFIL